MAKTADVGASTHKARKPKKEISSLEITKGESGGHVMTHRFTHMEHAPEVHVFGASEGSQAMKHVAEHMDIPMADVGAGEGSEEKALESKESAET